MKTRKKVCGFVALAMALALAMDMTMAMAMAMAMALALAIPLQALALVGEMGFAKPRKKRCTLGASRIDFSRRGCLAGRRY